MPEARFKFQEAREYSIPWQALCTLSVQSSPAHSQHAAIFRGVLLDTLSRQYFAGLAQPVEV
ncbi:MAG: hypothetical protein ACQES5_12180, partial [Thermodesulfobacteriota bacterium]